MPFCVVEKPYLIWGADIAKDNAHFLKRIDTDIYFRTAHALLSPPDCEDAGEDDERHDVSSLLRLLWHHGVETLVMLLGAYIQAPSAIHAYFLKCRTEDLVEIGKFLLHEKKPRYNRLNDTPFTLKNLLNGIHQSSGWLERNAEVERFESALSNMLIDFTSAQHRSEYNSIKHGLRASHGPFALTVGIEHTFGVSPPDEEMQMVGFSRDASFFDVAKPLVNMTDRKSKINFQMERVSISWSLDRVICELQVISLLLHNTVSALRLASGAKPDTVAFNKLADGDSFWANYGSLHDSSVRTVSIRTECNESQLNLGTDKEVFASYRRRSGDS